MSNILKSCFTLLMFLHDQAKLIYLLHNKRCKVNSVIYSILCSNNIQHFYMLILKKRRSSFKIHHFSINSPPGILRANLTELARHLQTWKLYISYFYLTYNNLEELNTFWAFDFTTPFLEFRWVQDSRKN